MDPGSGSGLGTLDRNFNHLVFQSQPGVIVASAKILNTLLVTRVFMLRGLYVVTIAHWFRVYWSHSDVGHWLQVSAQSWNKLAIIKIRKLIFFRYTFRLENVNIIMVLYPNSYKKTAPDMLQWTAFILWTGFNYQTCIKVVNIWFLSFFRLFKFLDVN